VKRLRRYLYRSDAMCKVSLATYQCAGEGVDPLYNTQLARKHILSNLVVTLNDPTVRVYF